MQRQQYYWSDSSGGAVGENVQAEELLLQGGGLGKGVLEEFSGRVAGELVRPQQSMTAGVVQEQIKALFAVGQGRPCIEQCGDDTQKRNVFEKVAQRRQFSQAVVEEGRFSLCRSQRLAPREEESRRSPLSTQGEERCDFLLALQRVASLPNLLVRWLGLLDVCRSLLPLSFRVYAQLVRRISSLRIGFAENRVLQLQSLQTLLLHKYILSHHAFSNTARLFAHNLLVLEGASFGIDAQRLLSSTPSPLRLFLCPACRGIAFDSAANAETDARGGGDSTPKRGAGGGCLSRSDTPVETVLCDQTSQLASLDVLELHSMRVNEWIPLLLQEQQIQQLLWGLRHLRISDCEVNAFASRTLGLILAGTHETLERLTGDSCLRVFDQVLSNWDAEEDVSALRRPPSQVLQQTVGDFAFCRCSSEALLRATTLSLEGLHACLRAKSLLTRSVSAEEDTDEAEQQRREVERAAGGERAESGSSCCSTQESRRSSLSRHGLLQRQGGGIACEGEQGAPLPFVSSKTDDGCAGVLASKWFNRGLLQTLEFKGCSFSVRAVEELTKELLIPQTPWLKHLALRHCRLECRDAALFARALPEMRALETVDLSHNCIRDRGAALILAALQRLWHRRRLERRQNMTALRMRRASADSTGLGMPWYTSGVSATAARRLSRVEGVPSFSLRQEGVGAFAAMHHRGRRGASRRPRGNLCAGSSSAAASWSASPLVGVDLGNNKIRGGLAFVAVAAAFIADAAEERLQLLCLRGNEMRRSAVAALFAACQVYAQRRGVFRGALAASKAAREVQLKATRKAAELRLEERSRLEESLEDDQETLRLVSLARKVTDLRLSAASLASDALLAAISASCCALGGSADAEVAAAANAASGAARAASSCSEVAAAFVAPRDGGEEPGGCCALHFAEASEFESEEEETKRGACWQLMVDLRSGDAPVCGECFSGGLYADTARREDARRRLFSGRLLCFCCFCDPPKAAERRAAAAAADSFSGSEGAAAGEGLLRSSLRRGDCRGCGVCGCVLAVDASNEILEEEAPLDEARRLGEAGERRRFSLEETTSTSSTCKTRQQPLSEQSQRALSYKDSRPPSEQPHPLSRRSFSEGHGEESASECLSGKEGRAASSRSRPRCLWVQATGSAADVSSSSLVTLPPSTMTAAGEATAAAGESLRSREATRSLLREAVLAAAAASRASAREAAFFACLVEERSKAAPFFAAGVLAKRRVALRLQRLVRWSQPEFADVPSEISGDFRLFSKRSREVLAQLVEQQRSVRELLAKVVSTAKKDFCKFSATRPRRGADGKGAAADLSGVARALSECVFEGFHREVARARGAGAAEEGENEASSSDCPASDAAAAASTSSGDCRSSGSTKSGKFQRCPEAPFREGVSRRRLVPSPTSPAVRAAVLSSAFCGEENSRRYQGPRRYAAAERGGAAAPSGEEEEAMPLLRRQASLAEPRGIHSPDSDFYDAEVHSPPSARPPPPSEFDAGSAHSNSPESPAFLAATAVAGNLSLCEGPDGCRCSAEASTLRWKRRLYWRDVHPHSRKQK